MKDELLYDAVSGRFFNSYTTRSKESCRGTNDLLNSMLENNGYLTLAEAYDCIYDELGLSRPGFYHELNEDGNPINPYEWGWTKDNKEFHHLTVKELHPCGCPYCGRSW